MKRYQVFTLLSILSVTMTSCLCKQWDRVEHLDREKKFQLSWNVSETHVIFELVVNTTGWIGIGISANGGMANSDIHIGWVKNGNVFLTDRHGGDFNGYPPLDEGQDLSLMGGWECDGRTSIVFKRQLAACDPLQDRPITRDTTRLIFAYNDLDPKGEDLQAADIHQVRGVKSLLLFEKSKKQLSTDEASESFSILNDGSRMSSASTYYHCRLVEIPALDGKRHVTKIEPVIEEGNERFVHHMTLLACASTLQNPSSKVGRGSNCYGGSLAEWRHCIHVMAGWAVGSGAMIFPKNVGLPIGIPGQMRYVTLSIHYNNQLNEEIIDHSGFKFTYTSQLRDHEAGMMAVGHYLAGYNLVVPPNTDTFDVHATCGPTCIAGAMDIARETSINIIGAFLHTHLTGRKIYLRHIRNGTELPPIASDEAYDFDFQETREISPGRRVIRGDQLTTTCTYSTTGKSNLTEGGLGTDEEMCSAFIFFYPRIPLTICNSAPYNGLSTVKKLLGVETVRPVNASPIYLLNRFKNLLITSPSEMANHTLDVAINNFPWTEKQRERLSEGFRDAPLMQMCVGPQPLVPFESKVPPLQKFQPYVNPRPQATCVKTPHPLSTSRVIDKCLVTSQ